MQSWRESYNEKGRVFFICGQKAKKKRRQKKRMRGKQWDKKVGVTKKGKGKKHAQGKRRDNRKGGEA